MMIESRCIFVKTKGNRISVSDREIFLVPCPGHHLQSVFEPIFGRGRAKHHNEGLVLGVEHERSREAASRLASNACLDADNILSLEQFVSVGPVDGLDDHLPLSVELEYSFVSGSPDDFAQERSGHSLLGHEVDVFATAVVVDMV